ILVRRRFYVQHGDESFPGTHDYWLGEVYPAAFSYGCGRHQAQPLASAGVGLEYRYPLTGLDAFEMEAWDDPVVCKTESEPEVVVEWDHPAFFFNRISACLFRRVIALIAASRFSAALR